jgi:hypothetical protein
MRLTAPAVHQVDNPIPEGGTGYEFELASSVQVVEEPLAASRDVWKDAQDVVVGEIQLGQRLHEANSAVSLALG